MDKKSKQNKMIIDSAEKLTRVKKELKDKIRDVSVSVCGGTGCAALGSYDVFKKLSDDLNDEKTEVIYTGCKGLCQRGPLVEVKTRDREIFYTKITVNDLQEIVEVTLRQDSVAKRFLYKENSMTDAVQDKMSIPFYKGQVKNALKRCGEVDPASINSYIMQGGFEAFFKAQSMNPSEIIDEVEKSGLRGKGGGGFLTGRKWRACVNAKKDGSDSYVVCNGDEGDPGAFMDCALMEGDPFSVIEGMMICALATQSQKGYIYVRHEYPVAVKRLSNAINQCRDSGLLGSHEAALNFDITIVRGGGAFVCGESTALMRSIEGNIGEPRAKYIRSVVKGLFDMPTVLNNVETFASVPSVFLNGALFKIGTEYSKGTKAFCLTGKVVNTGLIEVPMGTTLRQIIFDIGGGIVEGRKFKAVQTGGPSGGCLGSEFLDLPVDFDALKKAGSMMGSGGMIVMDENSCMVDVAKYFLNFLKGQSCGKCAPCREGVHMLWQMVENITTGKGEEGDLDKIKRLALDIKETALCGLGKSAPNPLLSAIDNFKDEFEAHIKDKMCPAGVCRDLIMFSISYDKCTGCTLCKNVCPEDAITGEKNEVHVIDSQKCISCALCRDVCRFDAVSAVSKFT
jgi:NADH:ubiquinone oxidoreductase subunit F (NADH-binding)/NAD-dependent dihydropyrimidine dehydrogenase PreA subunit/(2Fe-2S) ferredoxin